MSARAAMLENEDLGYGITAVDTGFQRPFFDASHLVVENGRAAFVDVGTSFSAPLLMAALADRGLAPESVEYVILTHVHLDHAGGAGEMMRRLPRARLVVHPRGARHMIDPGRLWAGATAVYGEQAMRRCVRQRRPGRALACRRGAGRLPARAGRPLAALPRYAGSRAPSRLRVGRGLARDVHGRHLRRVVPRAGERARRLHPAHDDARPVRAGGAPAAPSIACSASSRRSRT